MNEISPLHSTAGPEPGEASGRADRDGTVADAAASPSTMPVRTAALAYSRTALRELLAPRRPFSEPQRAALAHGRKRRAQVICSSCGTPAPRLAHGGRDEPGLCAACVATLEAEEAAQEAAAELSERQYKRREALRALFPGETHPALRRRRAYLDCETTGLGDDPEQVDELLELALVDDTGSPLLHTMLRPRLRTAWPDAQAIHGIAPANVVDAPSFASIAPKLEAVLVDVDELVIYNATFDLGFMPPAVRHLAEPKARCAMRAVAAWFAWCVQAPGRDRWLRLGDACVAAGLSRPARAHRALDDAQALRSLWRWLERRVMERAMDDQAELGREADAKVDVDQSRLCPSPTPHDVAGGGAPSR